MGYIAVEFWPDDFAAIVFATSVRGVIVIEAAGNGAQDLDDAIYDVVPTGFPTTWRNSFNRTNPQSGAIIVGAGAPPPGTHTRTHGPDRSRLDFSNFGARVDVQGWGDEVTTCGYGDLQGGSSEDLWYTDIFSGTSSASPIVVGAVGCIQGGLQALGRPLLTPVAAQDLLRRTGSPQQDAPGRPATQRIGNRPDLFAAFGDLAIGLQKDLLKDKDTVKDHEKIKDAKEKDKEKEDLKDLKDFKESDKDRDKVKDTKESKEKIETKEFKDKEGKEKEKEVKDKEGKETEVRDFEWPAFHGLGVSDRLTRLEHAVANLAHFIRPADRPDLQRSALSGEADLAARLETQAADAKGLKDRKDVEKSREY